MQRSLFVISAGCAATSALAATRHSNTAAKFLAAEAPAPVKLAQHQAKDANWDGLSVQNNDTYASDYVKDEAPAPDNATFVKHEQWPKKGRWTIEPTSDKFGSARRWAGKSEAWEGSSSSDDSSSSGGGDITSSGGFGGHSPQWYVDKCEAISAACAAEQDATVEKFERDLSDLEAEYRRQLRILDGKEEDHADEVADVKAQKIAVKKQKMKVADAKKAVEENAHCPPELQEAKEKLYQLEAVPNKTPEDIEEECQQKKIVMEKEKCVEVLLAAEEVLAGERAEHSDEKDDLHGEKADEADAAAALPPQEKRVADAKAAWEAAKAKGPKIVTHAGTEGCQKDKDALLAQLEADISALEEEYRRQKRILEGKEDKHADEKEDVAEQKQVVKKQKMAVKDAKKAVKENAHCPPDLAEARDELARLEAVPNETEEDIEKECAARKKVLTLEECVVVLREAEEVLADEKEDYSGEKSELGHEHGEADAAAAALPPQEKRVADAKAAWEAAKAKGPKTAVTAGKEGCQKDKDALLAGLEADIRDLEAEYRRQKRILAGKEDDHAEEKADVEAQEDEVAKQKKRVAAAKDAVEKNAHCPPELAEAKKHLKDLQAVPNETPEDIEDECKAKKVVLEKEQCVEVLLEAQGILRENKVDYRGEKSELKGEERDEEAAADALPPQEKRVAKAKAALDAALAALEALKNCVNGGASDSGAKEETSSDAAPADEGKSAESGSVRAAAGSAIAIVIASIISSL
eukprot:TRINITY_DN1417_c0_g1_i3.p2 TRINITY_DN1417_c0_g1~~TRINITY_DN1417_c0_g1_i3.p2  ORF type:complete len:750 (-),score=380.54 TRINITY_DN1417_c0_g1_i3:167-2416(-)